MCRRLGIQPILITAYLPKVIGWLKWCTGRSRMPYVHVPWKHGCFWVCVQPVQKYAEYV